MQASLYGTAGDAAAGEGAASGGSRRGSSAPAEATTGEGLLLLLLERSADVRGSASSAASGAARATNMLLLSPVQLAAGGTAAAGAAAGSSSHPLHYRSRDSGTEDIRGQGTAALVRTNALTQSIFAEAALHRGTAATDSPLAATLAQRQHYSHARGSTRNADHPLISRQVRRHTQRRGPLCD